MTNTQRYELLLLAVPEITQDETKDVEKQLGILIKEHKGNLSSFDRWGKYLLSYSIRKNEYGVYFLARFDASGLAKLNSDLQSLLRIRFESVIMRNLLTTLDADVSTHYKRPRSLEEAPQEEGASILKNKKVEGLISAVDSLRGPRKKNIEDIVVPELDEGYEGDRNDDEDED